MDKKSVTIEYSTRRSYCHCCGHKLDKPETSIDREFHFTKDNCLEWLNLEDWKTEIDYPDEFSEIVQEFVYETIGFFATSSDTEILIDDKEIKKMKKFILEEVTA